MHYQLMPDLSPDEYQALKEDIRKRGVLVPVEVDEQEAILDGHHRVRAWTELRAEGVALPQYPRQMRAFGSDEEKVAHVLSLNLARRHLTAEQRRSLHAELRRQGMSYRQIGQLTGVDRMTAYKDVQAGVENSTPDQPARIVGADGKSYPATMPPPSPPHAGGVDAPGPPHAGGVAGEEEAPAPWQHIYSSESNEWYTPTQYIESARLVLGGIDVDPASNDHANGIVKATTYYTKTTDGLKHDWPGRVWLNPPYGRQQVSFVEKLLEHFASGMSTAAIVLVNSHATETDWFAPLWQHTLCFTDHRINFWGSDGPGSTHGNVFVYLGEEWPRFAKEFRQWGYVVRLVEL